MPEKKFKFKLGSDPEFSFLLQGRRVDASNLLNNNLLRKKGFTKKNYGFECSGGQIGWDGCNATAELRPSPSDSLDKIVSNIKSILTKTHEQLPIFDMSVLSTFAPVGGHIHFEISQEMHNSSQKIQLLHKKISSYFLPIMISENKINLRLRTRGHDYGTLIDFHGDNRFQKDDGSYDYTYEFRTPSAEWLTTEKVCRATFAYMGVVYNEILHRPTNFAKHMGIVYKNNEQAKALHQLTITDYVGITEGLFLQIKKAVRSFELYPDFKEEIEYILNPKKVMADKRKVEYNIIKGWNLGKSAKILKPKVRDIMNDKKFKTISESIDIEQTSGLMNISYNDDINVDFFVRSLSERAAAFNWKLKNSYFIFGLKKGIESYFIFDKNKKLFQGIEEIKTISDRAAVDNLMQKILNKYSRGQSKMINPMTGEVEKPEAIMIGLPYNSRIKKNPREFIKLIYKLEENKLQPVPLEISSKNLVDDIDGPEKNYGKLYKAIFEIKDENESKTDIGGVKFDTDSQGRRIALENTMVIIDQIERDEANNEENRNTDTEECLISLPDMRAWSPYMSPRVQNSRSFIEMLNADIEITPASAHTNSITEEEEYPIDTDLN